MKKDTKDFIILITILEFSWFAFQNFIRKNMINELRHNYNSFLLIVK